MKTRRIPILTCLAALASIPAAWAAGEASTNSFGNPSFELGRDGWQLDKAGKTECQLVVDDKDAADGQYSALLTMGPAEEWGAQFGQSFPAGDMGKTYTFAVFAKSVKGPVEVTLQVERSAEPCDRAGESEPMHLTEEWQEFHLTFTVEQKFHQGWFSYVSCTQPNAQFRVDMYRLYEGQYKPYKEIAEQQAAVAAVRLFDSGARSSAPLTAEDLTNRTGWTEIGQEDVAHKFKGDAVLLNDRLACVLRRGAHGAEVYSIGSDAATPRAVLSPLGAAMADKLTSFTIVENNPGAAAADVVFATGDKKTLTLRYQLRVGQPFVQTEARAEASGLRVEAPCRFAVMLDFFSDDIVIDGAALPVAQAELPSDNIVLHLAPDGQAIVMTVVKTSEEDIRVSLSGDGDERRIDSTELRYGKDGKIWVGVMTGAAIWHEQEIAPEQAGQVVRMDWKPPFPAQWRVDWRRVENATDSWEMITERPDRSYAKPGLFGEPDTIPKNRKRWTTVLGDFRYPCWLDKNGLAFLQPLKSDALRFQGPAIVYPINRISATALDTFTVVDIVRNTLGVGPCEYVLDVEGQQSEYKGMATCAVRDALNPIYEAKQQVERKAEVEKVLEDLMIFIRHIRGRIESYVTFGHETFAYLEEQKNAHPELSEPLAELEALARRIDDKYAERQEKIKTPDFVAQTVEDFRKTVLNDQGDDAAAQCKLFTERWVDIGGNQDELVGECRWAAKMLRQRAGLMMAADPRLADVAKKIRQRSQVVLRNPANHESAEH
ncbi:MAG: carbohydrate binding domain-containing protein [Candidatus Sumerlaeota bacterium]|nr:carbohydrate binding domain-containing protein [Candidatus Sumerlaeota bacterium]